MIKCIRGSLDLKYSELKNAIKDGAKPFPVYLLEGEDAYFRERGLAALKSRYLSEPSLNLAVFDGADCHGGEFASSLAAYPFMSEKRLTVAREFYPKRGSDKELEEFLSNPCETSILIILNEKPCEYLKKSGSVCFVDCSKADTSVLARWIKATCAAAEVNISAELAATVATYCLSDMTRIAAETEKLIDYAGKGGSITEEDVSLLVPRDTEYKIYEMTDYIGKKKFSQAYAVIAEMLGKGEPPQRIIISIYNYFRRLLFSAISGKTAAELASCFGIKEFAASKTIQQAKLFKLRPLKKIVDMLADSDYAVKSGLADADEKMWIAVFGIMTDDPS